MTAYVIGLVELANLDQWQPEYRNAVTPLIEKYGGRYLVRGGEITTLEGDWDIHRVVILEFPSADHAKKFFASEEYAPVAEIRHRAADSKTFMVEGV